MNKKEIIEFVKEVIEYLPDNCSAEYFTDDETAWYSEDDIINYIKSMCGE